MEFTVSETKGENALYPRGEQGATMLTFKIG